MPLKETAVSEDMRDTRAARYSPPRTYWDEAVLPSGMPRRAWRKLAVSLRRMGAAELDRRWDAGRHLIETNGVTYNLYGDPAGRARPWSLDPIPLVIDAAEWSGIERAVAQRALLMNRILADLYGSQRLLHDRLLPAGLVFSNPDFLRPCRGIDPVGGVYLNVFAVDIARSQNGTWWVISDRTQSPSGIGYALENRMVSAHTLPSAFNQSQVRSLRQSLDQLRRSLLRLGAGRSSSARVVVLTPGPHNETYFEHSFLAHHWGFPLVEGADLTVRDNHVFLKTLSGLEPVDVILRRTDDSFCDPVELRGDSLLGIPGLTQALRLGNVAVANTLGSGFAETPATMAFLESLCQELLGERLRMPSVATWWCGQEDARRYVREHLEGLVIKPVARRPGLHPYFPETMSAAQREDLLARIEASPESFVAQEQVALSTAPSRTEGGLAPRHVVLRVFAFWDGGGYSVMPGGLTRVSTSSTSLVVSMQMGGGSKDTWVLGGAEPPDTDDRPGEFVAVPADVPSRVADNLFWMGRYTERLESDVRLVRALLPSLSGEDDFGGTVSIESAAHLLASLGYLGEGFSAMSIGQRRWHLEKFFTDMVYDQTRMTGISWNLKNVSRVAWPLKARFSQDTWRLLKDLDTALSASRPVDPEVRIVAQMRLLDRVVSIMSALGGLMMENTTRGPGWTFLQIGKRLERAMQTLELLIATFDAPPSAADAMQNILRVADSSITYRARYQTALRPEYVLELLLQDGLNPRSLMFQLAALNEHLAQLPRHASVDDTSALLAREALQSVRDLELRALCEGDMQALGDLARQLKGTLSDISDALSAAYFSHSVSVRLATPY